MTYHKITPNDIKRTIIKHLKPNKYYLTVCSHVVRDGKYTDYLIRLVQKQIKTDNGVGTAYQLVAINQNNKRTTVLGTLSVLPTRYSSMNGCDIAWDDADFDSSIFCNLYDSRVVHDDADDIKKFGFKWMRVKEPEPMRWGELYEIGPDIARDIAKQQGAYDEVNPNWENLDHSFYLQSAEHKEE